MYGESVFKEIASDFGPRHEIYIPFSPVLIRMDDYGYVDCINDCCFVMDDYGDAIITPWVFWPEVYS
jgi:hypothetical protein